MIMTEDKARKAAARQRMAQTGEPYSVARRAAADEHAIPPGEPAEDAGASDAHPRSQEQAGQAEQAASGVWGSSPRGYPRVEKGSWPKASEQGIPSSGGCEIRTREALPPTRFPSLLACVRGRSGRSKVLVTGSAGALRTLPHASE